jgi:hypothetical protein
MMNPNIQVNLMKGNLIRGFNAGSLQTFIVGHFVISGMIFDERITAAGT